MQCTRITELAIVPLNVSCSIGEASSERRVIRGPDCGARQGFRPEKITLPMRLVGNREKEPAGRPIASGCSLRAAVKFYGADGYVDGFTAPNRLARAPAVAAHAPALSPPQP